MIMTTKSIIGYVLVSTVALINDGRFSGGSHGFVVGHVTPEAAEGGPIALVEDGDTIIIDAEANQITVDISDEEMQQRKARWQPDRKSTRLNSSHVAISYAVFCL